MHESFVWNKNKEILNLRQHGVDFTTASNVFFDPQRVIFTDGSHSREEDRCFCLGLIGNRVLTVRFTQRFGKIRIFGAGYWRKGRKIYETQNKR